MTVPVDNSKNSMILGWPTVALHAQRPAEFPSFLSGSVDRRFSGHAGIASAGPAMECR